MTLIAYKAEKLKTDQKTFKYFLSYLYHLSTSNLTVKL